MPLGQIIEKRLGIGLIIGFRIEAAALAFRYHGVLGGMAGFCPMALDRANVNFVEFWNTAFSRRRFGMSGHTDKKKRLLAFHQRRLDAHNARVVKLNLLYQPIAE